jgi:hypothetical protein
MARKMGKPSTAKKRADNLFSKIVRSRGYCQNCGRTQSLQCAHIISRRFSHTRCIEGNAFCLDAKCHIFFTDHPASFGIFVLEQIGADAHDELITLSQQTSKVVWIDVVQRLKLRAKELELV